MKNLIKNPSLACVQLLSLIMLGCAPAEPEKLAGSTMGTYYQVTTRTNECVDYAEAIEQRLAQLNQSLSTYIPDSELSLINQTPAGEVIHLNKELEQVLQTAEIVWRQTDGAFDVTIGPLVNLWGFGPDQAQARTTPPDDQQQAARQRIGMSLLDLAGAQLIKQHAETYIDLSALAKGFAVDELAQILLEQGCANFMVDIGGEILAVGFNPQGQPWRLGIETPSAEQVGQVHTVIALSDLAIATSGDYRNFRMVDGEAIDHVLDPRTGRPGTSQVVSATVLHPSAMLADAYATALMVLGEDEGMALAEELGLAVYLIMRSEAPGATRPWRLRYTRSMAELLPESGLQ